MGRRVGKGEMMVVVERACERVEFAKTGQEQKKKPSENPMGMLDTPSPVQSTVKHHKT